MKILVVDDEAMTLKALTKSLEDNGYEVESAENSIEALMIVNSKKIDLIISDIIMPCLSGFTLATMLKNFYFLKIPVILISSFAKENVLLKLHMAGAVDFMEKPIDYKRLFSKIEEWRTKVS